ncbi:MAG: hypothetical protein JXR83_22465, partial [Deltaproteobacteria bacterium]|nr:hypothetical protein [Deltaproteobacteria bacterium]
MEEQIRTHLKALEASPANPEALAALDALYTQAASWEPLAKVYEENAQRLADTTRSPDLYLRAAEIYQGRLNRNDKAERCLRRALDLDGRNRSALSQLFPALKSSGRFAEAADVLERLAESAVDSHERARRLEELGILLDEQLNQPERALVALQSAFSADRTLKSALLRGVSIYQRRGRHELAKGLLDVLLEEAKDAEDAKLLADRYVEVAFKLLLSPARHDAARDAVARTLALVPDHPDAIDLRNRLEKYGSEWETHVRLLRDGAMEARDKTTAASRYLSIAEHYWIYGKNFERTEEFLDKAFTLVSGYWPAVRFLERLCREAQRTEHLLQRLNKMALELTDVRVAVDLWLLIALLEAEAGADRDKLARIYGKVTEIDPGNKSAATALTELYLDAGQFEQAATAQARFAREVRDPRQRRAAHLAVAQLYKDQLDDPAEAIKHFEAAREIDANDAEFGEALEELYGKVGRHTDHARLIEKRIERSTDARMRVALYDKLAAIYAGDLDDPLLAFEAMRKAYAIEPRAAREGELERMADSLARVGDLAQTYLAATGRVEDVGERKRLLLRVASLANQASQPQLARDALSRILNEDPDNEQALAALETLVAKGADARGLAETLEARLAVARATKERRMLLSRLAQLYVQELRESGRAIERYRALLEIDPNDGEALEALDGLLRREERWRELSQVIEKRIGRAEGPQAAELKLRLARLFEERLDKPREALALYEELHAAAPDRLDLVAALERLLARGIEPHRVAGILQPHYAAVGAYRRQVEMIDLRRQGIEDAKQRSQLAREAARILETELRSPREAFASLCSALLDDPADPELPRDLDRLAEAATAHDELAAVLSKASAALPESPAKVALEARRAAILESRLGDAEAAIAAHRSLLRQNPGNLASLDALIGLLERTDQAAELVQWLEVRRGFASPEEQPLIDERLGRVLADQLGQPEAAIAALERARAASDPRVRERALVLLDQIYRERNDQAPLLPVLVDRAELAVGTERAELFARIGELRLHVGEAEAALEAFRQSIELDGRNRRAADGLTALMSEPQVSTAVRREAAVLIEPLRRSEQDLVRLATVLKVRLATAEQRAERRALVAETALLMAQDLDDSDGALQLLLEHIAADPEDDKSQQLAENVAIASGALDRLLATMLQIVDAGGPAAESYGRRAAALATERGQLPVARAAIEKMIALQPTSAALCAELVNTARQENNPVALGNALLGLARVAGSEQAHAALTEAAEVFVNADEYEHAIGALRQHLMQFGFELAVADRLATLLAGLGRHGEIGGLWHEALGIAAPQQVAEIALRLGAVQLGPLESPEAAVKNFALCVERSVDEELTRRAVAMLDGIARGESSARDIARVALADHYRRTGNARPLIEILEHTAEATAEAEARAALLDEVAVLRSSTLDEPTLAFAAASRAFRTAPSEQRLAQLRELAEKAGSEEAYVALLDEIAEEAGDPALAVGLLHEAAGVAAGKLNDRAARVRLLQKVLALAPGDAVALEALEEVHREAAETGELVAVLKRKAAATGDKEENFAIRMQISKLLLEDGDHQQAVAVLRDLYSDHQDRSEVLAALDVAFTRMGDHPGLAIVLDRRIRTESDQTARSALATRLGRTHLATGQLREALAALVAAAADAPRDPALAAALGELLQRAKQSGTPAPVEVADVLETVLRAVGSLEDLPPVLEIKLEAATDRPTRQKLLLEIAHVQETVLGQAPLAFMTACRALREEPGEIEALDRLSRIARRSRSEEELVDVLEEMLDEVEDPVVQSRLHAGVAELQELTNQSVSRILLHLEKAHQLTPDDQAVAESLVRIGRGKAVSAALANAMARVAAASALAGESDKARELWLEAAEMHEEQGDIEGALADLQALVDFDARFLPALRSLDRIYERLGRHFELVRVLEQEIELAETVQVRGELMLRLAEHKRVALLDPIGASAVVEKVALEIPGAVGLVAALERVAGDLAASPGPEAGEARARVAGLLAPRYEASGEASKLVDILEARLPGLTEVGERRGVLLRVAKLRSSLGQPELAFTALSRALKESPDNDVLRNSVEQAAAESGEVESLVGLYEDIADSDVEAELALEYRRRIAALCRGPLGDPLRALGHYDQICRLLGAPEEDDEGRRMVRLQVVEAMIEIARAAEAWGPLAAALTRRAQLDPDAGCRRAAVLELARLNLGPLGDVGSAFSMARSLIANDPNDVEAIDLALQTSEQQGRFDEQAGLLTQRIELTPDPKQRLALRFRLGRLLDETLDRPDEAMAHFNDILEADPAHQETRTYLEERLSRPRADRVASVDTLEAAYAKTGDWKKAISVIEGQVQDAERRNDASTARQLLLRIGD